MGWIEFSASVIGSLLSWPLAIVVLAILFRRQIAKKIGDVEEFNVGNFAAGKFIRQRILEASVKTSEIPGMHSVEDTVGGLTVEDTVRGFPVEDTVGGGDEQQGGEEAYAEASSDEAYAEASSDEADLFPIPYSNTAFTMMLDRAKRLADQHPAESIDIAFDSLATTVISIARLKDPELLPDASISAALKTLGAPNEIVEAATELEDTRADVLNKSDVVQKEDAEAYVQVVLNLAYKIAT